MAKSFFSKSILNHNNEAYAVYYFTIKKVVMNI